jgi:hypothetical protein
MPRSQAYRPRPPSSHGREQQRGSSGVFRIGLGGRSGGTRGMRNEGTSGNGSGFGISNPGMLCLLCLIESGTGSDNPS